MLDKDVVDGEEMLREITVVLDVGDEENSDSMIIVGGNVLKAIGFNMAVEKVIRRGLVYERDPKEEG